MTTKALSIKGKNGKLNFIKIRNFALQKTLLRKLKWLWLAWLSGLSDSLWTERLLVRIPVRAHAWVVDQVPSWGCARGN